MSLRIFFYTAVEGELVNLSRAARKVWQEYGELVQVVARSRRRGPREEGVANLAVAADLIVVHLMGGPDSLPGLEEIIETAREKDIPLAVLPSLGEEGEGLLGMSHIPPEDYRQVRLYVGYGGEVNFTNLLLWAAGRYGAAAVGFNPPQPVPWQGLYHPDCPRPEEAVAFLQEERKTGRPVIGILFYQSHWLAGNTEFVEALVREIEAGGGVALPVFLYATKKDELGSRGLAWVVDNYLMDNGQPVVDVLITTMMFAQTMATPTFGRVPESDVYRRLGVPLIKAILSLTPQGEWDENLRGLSPLDVVMNVALPEFDGALITVPVAFREEVEEDDFTGATLVRYVAYPERVARVAALALRWARLRHKPNREKKVAVILHNYPPRNDRIGCAFGLDTPASVHRLLVALREAGYNVGEVPPDGAALMERLLAGLTNEREWLPAPELERRAAVRVDRHRYGEWFGCFPARVQEHLARDWGPPPGEVFVIGRNLLLPGFLLGNVFLGVQPPRGFQEDPVKIYHSPDLAPPHHYLAYYRWLRDEFGADLIFHMGKHGSLEWLPGKGTGLSAACFPDLAIADLPHVYPYIVNDPGEGTQAKRRSHACIIDHLVPVMTRADTYDELAAIEVLLQEYYTARTMDQSRLPVLQQAIWDRVTAAHLDRDLGLAGKPGPEGWETFLEHLHSYLFEIKDTLIRDGLHILGQPPSGEALVEMLLALTRLATGSVPSLREALAGLAGYTYQELLSRPGYFSPAAGRTYGQILMEIDDRARDLLAIFAAFGFARQHIGRVMEEVVGREDAGLLAVLDYVATRLVPRLTSTRQELSSCLTALEGGFIPPGPSGAPTRGMADILPTGRNFYSIDPRAVPTRAAWEVGRALGEALLERYREETGTYPRSVGMVVWATSNMRTGGDDIAQALYLLGVRPVWEERSGRVKDLEVIPLAELGQPRVDVTVRASGLFRDAFLNVIHLLDRAVEMVAGLEEPEEMNFVAAHVRAETAAGIAAGKRREEAREEARWRVFSDPPGAYGAGVNELVTAGNWQEARDLGEAYITWGGYAYGCRTFGRKAREIFRRRLALVEATVKNEDSREIDIFDCDDFYAYHGGMVAAVKAVKGVAPRSFSGDSSDPQRVRVRTLEEETRHIFRSRVLNPKWIEGMKRHGYKGAGDLSHLVEIAFGWDASAGVLEDWEYEALARKYALDPDMQQWFQEVNPWALENIVSRLLEAVERGMWSAPPEMLQALKELYLEVEGEMEGRTEPAPT
ncbi:MAG: cobaltochelatase subunit CobN [Clostridia bacterium]|nr:MAG: cobaltochelatase subunit CobN [Clostridia bacterium]